MPAADTPTTRRRSAAAWLPGPALPPGSPSDHPASLPWVQVEQPQQAEEKKGKAKATGKRFEIKKWNAVAM